MTRVRDFDELFRHDAFVKTLARRLAADAASADDVAQEAWLAAWRTPPDDRGPLRHWLACAVRGAASNLRRAFARRTRYERAAARAEAAAPERIAEREESRRLLHEAVSALDEPYRTVVLLRYFEGRTPTEIARITGAPVETVRTRLKRAQAALRSRLGADGSAGDAWRSVLLPLTGWSADAFGGAGGAAAGGTATGGAAWIGGATMGAKAKTAVAAFVAATAALTVGAYEVGAAEAAALTARVAPHVRTERGSPGFESRAATGVRVSQGDDASTSGRGAASAADRAPVPALDAALGTVLHGRLTDDGGAAIPDADLRFVDENGVLRVAKSDAEGRYAQPGFGPGSWTASVDARGCGPFEALVVVAGEPEIRFDVLLRRATAIAVELRTDDAAALARPSGLAHRWAAYAFREAPSALPRTDHAVLSGVGLGRFRSGAKGDGRPSGATSTIGFLETTADPPFVLVLAHGSAIIAERRIDRPTDRIVFELDAATVRGAFGAVRARFVAAESGAPLAGLRVRCGGGESSGAPVAADADGRCRFEGLRPGMSRMESDFAAKGRERFSFEVDVVGGATTDLGDVPIALAVEVAGKLLHSDGGAADAASYRRPVLRHASVASLDSGGVCSDRTSYAFDPDGTIRLRDLGPGRRLVQLVASDESTGATAISSRIVDLSSGPMTGLEFSFPPMGRLALEIAPSEAHGVVRIDDATGAPVHAFRANQAATYRFELPLGSYRVRTSGVGGRERTFTVR